MAREKIVLVGAGSAVFTRGMVIDLIMRGWDAELALVDVNPDALAVAKAALEGSRDIRPSPRARRVRGLAGDCRETGGRAA